VHGLFRKKYSTTQEVKVSAKAIVEGVPSFGKSFMQLRISMKEARLT